MKSRREIPAVGKLLAQVRADDLPHALVVQAIRDQVALERRGQRPESKLITRIEAAIEQLRRSQLQAVINGSGVIIHTNLGRVPLAPEALRSLHEAGRTYNNLEFDLNSGLRGNRGDYVERALAAICQAESACVVNNCAAALFLIVRHFTREKPVVVISRGELVQIGGGFRISEILQAAGATLREVGATNKTTVQDYAKALGKEAGLILKVHQSNFFMDGFVASPTTAELATLARKKRIPFVEDLGSGAIGATDALGLAEHEPTVADTLRAGADLVCFSGDKLFGGPQAGIIVGKRRFVSVLKRHPLFRALRCDKLILAALQATAELHLAKKSSAIPVLSFLATSAAELRQRGESIADQLRGLPIEVRLEQTHSKIGGGALPRSRIDSFAIALRSRNHSAGEIARRLRHCVPAIIGYIAHDSCKLDLRTIFPSQDCALVSAIHEALR
ncbi:MAG TPA: L-seryl-tRNA(Sec) selenium transferase [Chthoniobacterales bacterium]